MARAVEDRFAFNIPRVRDLVLDIYPIQSDKSVHEVMDRFDKHANLLALPIMEGETFLGLLTRRHFLNFFSKAYTKELFNRKSLHDLIAVAPQLTQTPLYPHADTRIDHVLLALMEQDAELMLEVFPVQEHGRLIGVVPVADLMLKISDSQSQLIHTLELLSDRLKGEVEHAALLQRALLPPSTLSLPGLSGFAQLLTSSEVGGDYYDYFNVGTHHAVLLVGDASGHGVASGTMVSAAKAGINILSTEGVSDPSEILARLNESIYGTARQSLLLTMFCVGIDTASGRLQFANAGHPFAYWWRAADRRWEMLESGGLPLGKAPNTSYASTSIQIAPGDRLFLYTDGVVEAESPQGEAFGFERLEAVLAEYGECAPEALQELLLEELRKHCASRAFADDITFFVVDYTEAVRTLQPAPAPVREQKKTDRDLVRIAETFYRAQLTPLSPKIARQSLVFLAEHAFADLLPRLCQDGIRRVLPRQDAFLQRLGWDKLMSQHEAGPEELSDLYRLLPHSGWQRSFEIGDSSEKALIIAELEASLAEQGGLAPEKLDTVVLLLDELIENGLYAAPRDGRNRPLYPKGMSRRLADGENLRIDLAVHDGILGISIRDNWGTLTPVIFLQRLVKHVHGEGLEAGVGGAGLYLLWRMADYVQFRVHPHVQTQVSAFLDLHGELNPEADKGFQFLYHNECNEVLAYE